MRLPTVTIVADNKKGRKIINESDFDKSKHKLYEEKAASKKADTDKAEKKPAAKKKAASKK